MSHLEIFIFVDALGWDIVQSNDFLSDLMPYRHPVRMQFGYSCTAVPTILTGVHPDVHGHLSFFYKAGGKSPFWMFKYLAPVLKPDSFWRRGRIRNWVSRALKAYLGYTGYFQIYSVPFERLHYFDYCEKQDLFALDGLAPVPNLRDTLEKLKLKYLISDWHKPEQFNLEEAEKAAADRDMQFIFAYTAGFDSLMHFNVGQQEPMTKHLAFYEKHIRSIVETAKRYHETVNVTVFSDHGMTPLKGTYDLEADLAGAGLAFGRDYVSCLDSTMARFWYNSPDVKDKVHAAAQNAPGHWLTMDELKRNGVFFKDDKFGEDFLLMNPGIQIVPSDMGIKAIPGMHGFHPEDKDSLAAILSTSSFAGSEVAEVADYFKLMVDRAGKLA